MKFATTIRTAAAATFLAATAMTGASADTIVYISTSGNVGGAGTDSNVYIKLHGPNGSTKRVRLQDKLDGNILEKGDTDILYFTDDIGPGVTKIELESLGDYSGSDWHLQDITTVTGSQTDILALMNPLSNKSAALRNRVSESTFPYDDWITGKESYPGTTAGRTKKGIELLRKEPIAAPDGGADGVNTTIYAVMKSDGLDGNSPAQVNMLKSFTRSETMSLSTSTTNAVKAGFKVGASYSKRLASGAKLRVSGSVSGAYEWAKTKVDEKTWSVSSVTQTEDKFAAAPGTFEFRILMTNGYMTVQPYKSLLSNESFVVSYLEDASPIDVRIVTFVAGELDDAKWNRSVAQPLAVARGKGDYEAQVRRLKEFGILSNPMSYDQAMK